VVPLESVAEPRARGEGVEAQIASRQRREAVREALADLSEEQREALVLARYHGMPYAEIAKTLGISVGAVKTRIFRAVETLKAHFSEGEHSWTAAT
jgi:RNA polymerase sigma-70 factor (ECF subfamily)